MRMSHVLMVVATLSRTNKSSLELSSCQMHVAALILGKKGCDAGSKSQTPGYSFVLFAFVMCRVLGGTTHHTVTHTHTHTHTL